MFDSKNVIVLDQMLVLTKEGKNDLVYENNTLLKVKMISNQHIVVEDDQQTSFQETRIFYKLYQQRI